MSLTKNPMNPIRAKPMAVAKAIFWNSIRNKKFVKIKKNSCVSKSFFIANLFGLAWCTFGQGDMNPS